MEEEEEQEEIVHTKKAAKKPKSMPTGKRKDKKASTDDGCVPPLELKITDVH